MDLTSVWLQQQVGGENYALGSFISKVFKSGSVRSVGYIARMGEKLNGNNILVS